MKRDDLSKVFNGNGHGDYEYALRLSTGYEVSIAAGNASAGFDHLARALWGEIGFPALSANKGDLKKTANSVIKEIESIVTEMSSADARSLLTMSLWRDALDEYTDIRRRATKPKKAKRKKKK